MSSFILNPYKVQASGGVSFPAFSNILAAYGLNNFNPAGSPGGNVLDGNANTASFSLVAPYPADYAAYIVGADSPPYGVQDWFDQNGGANTLVAPTFPTLQITTPVIVRDAGTSAANGTYTFSGLSNGKAYYNKAGTDPLVSSVCWSSDDAEWFINITSDDRLYAGGDDTSFPWQSTWTTGSGAGPAPTVAAGTQTGEIQFNGSSSCLATAGSLTLGTAATAYLRFKTTDVASTDILFEIGATPTATPFALSVRTVAGVLTVTVTDGTGLLFNTKTYNVSSNTWYIITVIIDTTLSAANQVKLLVNNSTSGVSAPVSTDLASGNLADGVLNVGARNQASNFLAGSATDLLLFSVAHDSTTATNRYNYINAL